MGPKPGVCQSCGGANSNEKYDRCSGCQRRFHREYDWPKPKPECLEWQGPRVRRGYGRLSRDRRHILVHRHVWSLANGPVPEGMQVGHHCDNPPCFRLDHLFLCTNLENQRDKVTKGRAKGPTRERGHGAVPVSMDAEIIAAHAAGESPQHIADRLGTSRTVIRRIVGTKK